MAVAEVYRSMRLAECEQRAFLLYAVGIPSEIVPIHGEFVLVVAEDVRDRALNELRRHEAESHAAFVPPPVTVKLHAGAWIGVLGYALIMLFAAWCAGENLFGVDWREAGALRSSVAQTGEWPRLVTALTLHGDVAHLIANLAFGVFFGYFAGQMLGPGVAWLSILIGAVLGNLLDSLLMSVGSSSIGASTAVFATLGLVAAHSWRQRSDSRMRWAHRWAPLIAGVALLAFTGAGGENTDVIAHVTGFLSGALLGVLHAWKPLASLDDRRVQLAAGLICAGVILGAWGAALR
ncbi:MAG: rhomboid family intramembrane serine protease [Lysobacterales bacterium]|jgi:rhomboid protease GluP|nr:MAG: rhomboid family intramembrane serine protease [Xanthomonadales bacterium]